ncbi:MAG: flagellar basal body-associated FliL family protein [Oligoflexia bacterium]|nr:flagellar basal body-associated FliL family protein [Oligoflexia bacterium]
MADEKKTQDSASLEGKKPILLIGIAGLNMIAMIMVVFVLWNSHKAEKAKPKLADVVEGVHNEDVNRDPAAINKDDVVGKLIPMETFLVNLAGTRGGKLVKIDFELEVENNEVMAEIEKRKPQIRDKVIILLSSKSHDYMSSKEGKLELRSEIKDVINEFLVSGKIKNIYFTNLVVN